MIQVCNLTKRYGSKKAVDQLDFVVRPGTVTGFVGPNGSGKSTTMRMIMGLDSPSEGQALINGTAYSQLAWPLREVGALLDGRAYHPGRSAEKHLLALAQANGIDRSRVAAALDAVGLTSVARKRTGTFSLGMGQRLGIAAALLGDPGVVLLDEPINGLDPDGIVWVRTLVRGMAAEGRTVLLSSHLIAEMALTADHLVVIGRGRLIAELSVAELKARAPDGMLVRTRQPEHLQAVLDRAGIRHQRHADGSLSVTGANPDAVAHLAAQAGIGLYELTPQRASLEDLYMALTHDHVEYQTGPRTSEDQSPIRIDNRRVS
jgi:ABC-2 type transport system ATP-binding protein